MIASRQRALVNPRDIPPPKVHEFKLEDFEFHPQFPYVRRDGKAVLSDELEFDLEIFL
jgi:hypothetical protein